MSTGRDARGWKRCKFYITAPNDAFFEKYLWMCMHTIILTDQVLSSWNSSDASTNNNKSGKSDQIGKVQWNANIFNCNKFMNFYKDFKESIELLCLPLLDYNFNSCCCYACWTALGSRNQLICHKMCICTQQTHLKKFYIKALHMVLLFFVMEVFSY